MSFLDVEVHAPRAQSLSFTDDALSVDLVDGRTVIVPLIWYPRLWHGSPQERNNFEIIGDGEYLHWPDLDEDLTTAGLLEGKRSAESPASLKNWLAAREPASTKNQKREKKPTRRES